MLNNLTSPHHFSLKGRISISKVPALRAVDTVASRLRRPKRAIPFLQQRYREESHCCAPAPINPISGIKGPTGMYS
jgi:hypothetical protein